MAFLLKNKTNPPSLVLGGFVVFILLLCSCGRQAVNYNVSILEKGAINTAFLQEIGAPEKALLSWYLLAYGNECNAKSSKIKCRILEALKISDECSDKHIRFLKKWFKDDILVNIKLKNCPVLPIDASIQNDYKRIELSRSFDTLRIHYEVWGMNNSQEKSWNVNRTDSFLIKGEQLRQIK